MGLNTVNALEIFKSLHTEYLHSGYQATDLAKFVGVSRMTVHRWLTGKSKPTEKKLKLIQAYLDTKN